MPEYKPYRPSPHAEARRVEMGLSVKEIKAVINDPEVTYPAGPGDWRIGKGDHPGGRTVYLGGRLAVMLGDEDGRVVTILWRGIAHERDETPTTAVPDPPDCFLLQTPVS